MQAGDYYQQQFASTMSSQFQNAGFPSNLDAYRQYVPGPSILYTPPSPPPTEKKKEEYRMFKSVRSYYEKYQDTILTIAALFLLDHYMFDGKFKTKLEQIMESLIGKATAKIQAPDVK